MCVWENAVVVSQKWWMLEISNICHCVQHPWKLTSKDFWSSRNERKALSQQKCVLRSNWSLGVHILRDIAEIGWASQNWMNIFSFISSETQEMGTETFRTVTIVFSTPENLLVGNSGAQGMKKSHFLSKNVLWEMLWEYLRNDECQSFQTFAIVFSTPDNLLVEISGALEMKESHFLNKNVCLGKCCRVSQNTVNARAFKHLSLCLAPLKTY